MRSMADVAIRPGHRNDSSVTETTRLELSSSGDLDHARPPLPNRSAARSSLVPARPRAQHAGRIRGCHRSTDRVGDKEDMAVRPVASATWSSRPKELEQAEGRLDTPARPTTSLCASHDDRHSSCRPAPCSTRTRPACHGARPLPDASDLRDSPTTWPMPATDRRPGFRDRARVGEPAAPGQGHLAQRLTGLCLDRLARHSIRAAAVRRQSAARTGALAQRPTPSIAELASGYRPRPPARHPVRRQGPVRLAGHPTTFGAAPYKDQLLGPSSATSARALRDAGAVLVAKLSLGALAMGDLWHGGRTRNPWNPGAAAAAARPPVRPRPWSPPDWCRSRSAPRRSARSSHRARAVRRRRAATDVRQRSAATARCRCRGRWTRSARSRAALSMLASSSTRSAAPTARIRAPRTGRSTGIRDRTWATCASAC